MFKRNLSPTMKTGWVSAAGHHKLLDREVSWTLCPCDNLALAAAWLFSHQDGHVILCEFCFESTLSQQVNVPQSCLLSFLTLPDRLTGTRAALYRTNTFHPTVALMEGEAEPRETDVVYLIRTGDT